MDPKIVGMLDKGATLVTPTRRLAAYCLSWANQFHATSHPVWDTPLLFAFNDWLHSLWDQALMNGSVDKVLMSDTQSLYAIEQIILQSKQGGLLLDTYATAKRAYAAWKILNQWCSLDIVEKEYTNIDLVSFQAWMERYGLFLKQNEAIDEAQLAEEVLTYLQTQPPQTLIFYGFEESTPLLAHFSESLTKIKWNVQWEAPLSTTPQKCVRYAFSSEEQEHRAAIDFAKYHYDKGKKHIAIVVPQLADYRQDLDKKLREMVAPLEACLPEQRVHQEYNISAAVPLIQYPFIQMASIGLKVASKGWSLSDYTHLVDSPWFHGNKDEKGERYRHLIWLKQRHRGALSIDHVLESLMRFHDVDFYWYATLNQVKTLLKNVHAPAHFTQWARFFRRLLKALQFPAITTLSSIEYQTFTRFESLLEELSSLDFVAQPVSYTTALTTLQKMASYIPFQPENKGARIQVLGMLEAAGQQFDALWVMGMNNEAWPPAAEHNPFIDIQEQRLRKMPHASAEREMEYALKMTERFKVSATEVIFSYSAQNKEKQCDVSELIRTVPLGEWKNHFILKNAESYFESKTRWLDTVEDEKAKPLDANESVKSTSRLLELQSACPFRAFAEFRLGALTSEEKGQWLQGNEQGIVIHRILEQWWKKGYRHEQTDALMRLIDVELKNIGLTTDVLAYFEVEKRRLFSLLKTYLAFEATRPLFHVIATEYRQSYTMGGLTFDLRFDRIDEDNEGRHYIIDYKTGAFHQMDWYGERLASPQLPLYALAYPNPALEGIRIIQLRHQACQTYSIEGETFQGVKASWTISLNRLIQDFTSGVAKVDPREGPSTCQFCHLQSFCRVHEEKEVSDD